MLGKAPFSGYERGSDFLEEGVPLKRCYVNGGQFLVPARFAYGEQGSGGVDGGDTADPMLNGGTAYFKAVGIVPPAPAGGVDDQVYRAGGDHV